MKRIILPLFLFITLNSVANEGKLLDKIVAIYDDQIITYSQVSRIKNTLEQRRQIARDIFPEKVNNNNDLINTIINTFIIRDGLKDLGYVISDSWVENQIKKREKQLGLTREMLIESLKSYQLSFEEYFELIRATDEFNVFYSNIIVPLISITDQEIKNEFIKNSSNKSSVSYKYNLVDFYIPSNGFKKSNLKKIKIDLLKFQKTGNLPSYLKSVETTNIGEISEDGLDSTIKSKLKKTIEGDFSDPILFNGSYHVFFVKKKEITDSEFYLQQKPRIKNKLIEKTAKKTSALWLNRERNKHYIKIIN